MANKTHSKRFEALKERYERGGCTKEQLQKFTKFGVITADEYKEITGEEYK